MKQFKRDKIRLYAFLTACLIIFILLSAFGVSAEGNNGVNETYADNGDYWRITATVTNYDIFVSNYEDKASVNDFLSLDAVFRSGDLVNSYWGAVNTRNGGNLVSYLNDDDARRLLNNFSQLYIPCISKLTYSNNYYFIRDMGASGGSNHAYNLYIMNTDGGEKSACGDGRYYGIWNLNNQGVLLCCSFIVGGELPGGGDSNYIALSSYYCTSYNLTDGPIVLQSFNESIGDGYKSFYYNDPSWAPTESFRGIIASTFACTFFDYDTFGYDIGPHLPPVATITDNSGSGSSSGAESASNNLYFPTSDFRFRINRYGEYYSGTAVDMDTTTTKFANSNYSEYRNNWGFGSIDFSAVLTDYQKEHPEEFTLNFEFNLQENIWLDYYNLDNKSAFCKYHLNCNTYTYTMGLDDFYSNGSIKTFNVQDIFSNMTIKNYSTQYDSHSYPNLYILDVSSFSSYYDFVNATKTDSHFSGCLFGSDSLAPWKIICGVYLSSSNDHSGYNKESYSFISQVSRQIDDSMSTNDNPYVPGDDESSNLPGDTNSNGGSSSSSSNGGNTLINNDNDTININDGNAEVVEDLYNDLTTSDGEDSLSERFVDLVNENAWITIMQETFSFIPSSIWVTVEIFVVTCLGILAASFVLRIILDLL